MKLPFMIVSRKRWLDRYNYTAKLENEYIELEADFLKLQRIHDATRIGIPLLQKRAFKLGQDYIKRMILEHARRRVR